MDEWFIRSAGGNNVVNYDGFMGFQYSNASSLPTTAIEEGGFNTTNKWDNPYNIVATIVKAGPPSELSDFLEQLEQLRHGTDFVELVTPARTFINGNIESINFTWTNDDTGPRMIEVQLGIREVRIVGSSSQNVGNSSGGQINNATNSECNNTVTSGRVQGEPASPRGMVQA